MLPTDTAVTVEAELDLFASSRHVHIPTAAVGAGGLPLEECVLTGLVEVEGLDYFPHASGLEGRWVPDGSGHGRLIGRAYGRERTDKLSLWGEGAD